MDAGNPPTAVQVSVPTFMTSPCREKSASRSPGQITRAPASPQVPVRHSRKPPDSGNSSEYTSWYSF